MRKEFKTMVICGFPGVGKSVAANNKSNIDDAESSAFSWVFDPSQPNKPRERNPEFPNNYGSHIEKLAGKYGYDVVLVSCHKEVREELDTRGIDYVFVVPEKNSKDEYMKRYLKRGSDVGFVNLLYVKWDEWLDEIENNGKHAVIHLGAGEYLSDILPL